MKGNITIAGSFAQKPLQGGHSWVLLQYILGFKQLVEAVVTGVHTLTPASRDEWWRDHDLPERLVLLSITGSMPDAYLNDFGSPLWHFEGFGARTSDYNVSLRASYYDTVFSE